MAIDWSVLALPKGRPTVLQRKDKARASAKGWRQAAKVVDARDAVDDAPACFVTGRRLGTNTLDEWSFRDRAHLEARSRNTRRKHDPENVISVCRAVHRLIHAGAIFLVDKRGGKATRRSDIDALAWNRRLITKGQEPCRVRKGLAVVELEKVAK